jgi:hypothetical protein
LSHNPSKVESIDENRNLMFDHTRSHRPRVPEKTAWSTRIESSLKNEYFRQNDQLIPADEFLELLKSLNSTVSSKPSELNFDYSYLGCQSKLSSHSSCCLAR